MEVGQMADPKPLETFRQARNPDDAYLCTEPSRLDPPVKGTAKEHDDHEGGDDHPATLERPRRDQ